MKVLIACEYSGITRTAFERLGWEAWSCDILPSEVPGRHYQRSVLDILQEGWDLMIAHPPCTYLSYAGMRNWYDEGRAMRRIKAAEFFMQLYDSPVPHVAVENPQGIMMKIFRKPDQEVHPWYFGEPQMKRTHLWLKNLPTLYWSKQDNLFGKATASSKPEPLQIQIRKSTGKPVRRHFTDTTVLGRIKTGHEKSRSFDSIAQAMAEQWTDYLTKK